MGNDNQVAVAKEKEQQEYVYTSDKILSIAGEPRYVKSNITDIQLEEYHVIHRDDKTHAFHKAIYTLRSSSYSKNIAVVFTHRLLNPDTGLFEVRVEKMKGRLNEIQELNFIEGLCVLEGALGGFSELIHHTKCPFAISERMIALNEKAQVRVWVSENFALNQITPNLNIRNENIMIHQAISQITNHINLEQRQKFSEVRFNVANFQRLVDAKNYVSMSLQNINRKAVLMEIGQKRESHSHSHNHSHNHEPREQPEKVVLQMEEYVKADETKSKKIEHKLQSSLPANSRSIQSVIIFSDPREREHQPLPREQLHKNHYQGLKQNIHQSSISPRTPIFRSISNQEQHQNFKSNRYERMSFAEQERAEQSEENPNSQRQSTRTKSIFKSNGEPKHIEQGENKANMEQNRQSKEESGNPDEMKTISSASLANKITESQIKISQLENKINKFKQNFQKQNPDRTRKSFQIQKSESSNEIRITVTPPKQAPKTPKKNEEKVSVIEKKSVQKLRIKTQTTYDYEKNQRELGRNISPQEIKRKQNNILEQVSTRRSSALEEQKKETSVTKYKKSLTANSSKKNQNLKFNSVSYDASNMSTTPHFVKSDLVSYGNDPSKLGNNETKRKIEFRYQAPHNESDLNNYNRSAVVEKGKYF